MHLNHSRGLSFAALYTFLSLPKACTTSSESLKNSPVSSLTYFQPPVMWWFMTTGMLRESASVIILCLVSQNVMTSVKKLGLSHHRCFQAGIKFWRCAIVCYDLAFVIFPSQKHCCISPTFGMDGLRYKNCKLNIKQDINPIWQLCVIGLCRCIQHCAYLDRLNACEIYDDDHMDPCMGHWIDE